MQSSFELVAVVCLSLATVISSCRGPGARPGPLASGDTVSMARETGAARPVRTGLERIARDGIRTLRGRAIGIITNHTAVDSRLRHIVDLVMESGEGKLVALFGPEHGVRGTARAGANVEDSRDPVTGVPVYSLYGGVRKPTREMLEGIDLLVYDIQDVGVRTYTYLSTLLGAMEAAAAADIEVWVLDRPDPLGGEILEGPVLEPGLESFVGPHPLPLRYGLTVGEFARLVNRERSLGARLRVVALEGWSRGTAPGFGGGVWIAPSPNIPTPETALLYAGFVLLEGTNLSEGRGTTRPFHLLGAPWLDSRGLLGELESRDLPGVGFRSVAFTPSASKYVGEACEGIEVHVVDSTILRPVETAMHVIRETRRLHPESFRFRERTFDLLAGTTRLREGLERGDSVSDLMAGWPGQHARFRRRVAGVLLYP